MMAGAFPEMVPPTIAAIEAAVEAAEERRDDVVVRCSSLGEECERRLWYAFRWAHKPQQFVGRILRLFETGNIQEDRIVSLLRMAGMAVEAVDPQTGGQFEVRFAEGHATGHTDGEVAGVPEAPKTRHLLECKTHNDKSFQQLLKHGVEVSKPVHYAQMQIYMRHRGLERALYVALNKNDETLYVERVRYDAAAAMRLEEKAERIAFADTPPTRQFDDPDERMAWKCRSCPALGVCHRGEWARRNCRTCLHSTPKPGGVWHCSRHDKSLTLQEQQAGCECHLYLPELVPGRQVDVSGSDHIETVTYEMPDGSTWVDLNHYEDAPGGPRQ